MSANKRKNYIVDFSASILRKEQMLLMTDGVIMKKFALPPGNTILVAAIIVLAKLLRSSIHRGCFSNTVTFFIIWQVLRRNN